MALATLCRQMRKKQREDGTGLIFKFRAFIVDHKARDGSTDEAALTRQRLQALGMIRKTQCIEWI